jgi:hypothetical protein
MEIIGIIWSIIIIIMSIILAIQGIRKVIISGYKFYLINLLSSLVYILFSIAMFIFTNTEINIGVNKILIIWIILNSCCIWLILMSIIELIWVKRFHNIYQEKWRKWVGTYLEYKPFERILFIKIR